MALLAAAVPVGEEQHTQVDWMCEVRMGLVRAVEEGLLEGQTRNEREQDLVRSAEQASIGNWQKAPGEVLVSIEH